LGPVLGGWLVDLAGWRYIFLINIPVAAVAIVLATRYLTESITRPDNRLDVSGATLATIGLGTLTWGLTLASEPRPGQLKLALLLILGAIAAIAVFIMIEKHRGDRALVPLEIFTTAQVVGLNLVTLLLYASLGALIVLLPYVLIEALSYSATQAAAAMLPLPVVAALLSPPAGSLAERVGARFMIAFGAVTLSAGMLLMTLISPGVSYWKGPLPPVLIVAIGLSAAVAPITTAVLSEVDTRFTGVASALNTATARMGGLLATSMVGSVFAAHGANATGPFHHLMLIFAGISLGAALIAATFLPTSNAATHASGR
jgi:MFS family permease